MRRISKLSVAAILMTGSQCIYALPEIESLGSSPQVAPGDVRPVVAGSTSSASIKDGTADSVHRQFVKLSSQLDSFASPAQQTKHQALGRSRRSAARLGLNTIAGQKRPAAQNQASYQFSLPDLEKQLIALNTSIASVSSKGTVPRAKTGRDSEALKAQFKTFSLKASDPSAVNVEYSRSGYPRRITGNFPLPVKGKSVANRVQGFLSENLEVLGFNDDTQFEGFETCNADLCIVKVEKFVGGLPIFGDSFTVIVKGDDIISLSGRYDRVPTGGQIYSKSLALTELEDIVRRHLGLGSKMLNRPIEASPGFRRISGEYRAVYKVRVVVSLTAAWDVYVSRQTGDVLDALTLVYEQSSVPSQGLDLTNTPRTFFSRQVTDSYFELIDDTFPEKSGEATTVYDAQNQLDWDTYLRTVSSDSPSDGWDPTAVSALHNNRQAYDYFLESFGRRGLTGSDDSMHTIVHVVYENADGTTHGENATFWTGNPNCD